MDEHNQIWDTLPYRYNPYLRTSLSDILDTLITTPKNCHRLIKTAREKQFIFI